MSEVVILNKSIFGMLYDFKQVRMMRSEPLHATTANESSGKYKQRISEGKHMVGACLKLTSPNFDGSHHIGKHVISSCWVETHILGGELWALQNE